MEATLFVTSEYTSKGNPMYTILSFSVECEWPTWVYASSMTPKIGVPLSLQIRFAVNGL